MEKITTEEAKKKSNVYYMPHHPILRTTSLTTKLRVVFDGSAKTSIGTSLNDKLIPGPNLQEDIMSIIVRFRAHEYVITADIQMMFRQIKVQKQDRDLQRILWRKDLTRTVDVYTLNTVTYGTSCAPYLAMRCCKQLAIEGSSEYPRAAAAVIKEFYMDDVLTGSSTIKQTIELQQQLTQLLARGQFNLRKWRSNEPSILQHLSQQCKTDELLVLDKQDAVKTLELLWNSKKDIFQFHINMKQDTKVTKIHILSIISQIYNPLGLIGPVLINAKRIMQELWRMQVGWDESVPQALYSNWINYCSSIQAINELEIPRNINPKNSVKRVILHGFSDASEKAYGACVYALSFNSKGEASCYLIASKSRVAPLKTITLPRMELNAALLLTRLIKVLQEALEDKVDSMFLWTDSTIVLHWIQTSPNLLKTFVANRVAEIQENIKNGSWHHVPSQDNPADYLSRGLAADKLADNQLWWHGPSWLPQRAEWPKQTLNQPEEIPETRRIVALTVVHSLPEAIFNFSSYLKLKRIIAFCKRFANNCQKRGLSGQLTVQELQEAEVSIIRIIQLNSYGQEIKKLKQNEPISTKSKILMLKPFLDEKGLLRVGGRLRNAPISSEQKHPIILPSKHFVTQLIIKNMHIQLLHCGTEHLLSRIRLKYWPISGRREVQKITRQCV